MNKILCGVDIGGTKCSIALIDETGSILDKIYTCEHVEKEENVLVKMLTKSVKEIIRRNDLQESDLPGIGVGFPGHIRFQDGVVITTSNLKGFKNFPLRDAFHGAGNQDGGL